MYDIERDEIVFKDKTFPVVISTGKAVTGMFSRFHEEIEIKCVREGQITVMVDTKAVTATENEIIFVNPYEVHSNLNVDDEYGSYDLFMLSIDFFEESGIGGIDLRKLFAEEQIRFKNLIKNQRAVDVIKKISACSAENGEFSRVYKCALFLELFAILLNTEISSTEGENYDNHVRFFRSIEPAVMKIRDNYSARLSGEELADMCRMSKYHFCRTFKRVMGVTPVQYQTECRLRIADILLQNRSLSISEVASRVGFDDEAYFSRCYKKYRGVSPKSKRAKLSK